VLWFSLVDDPSSRLDRFPIEEAQKKERQRPFDILGCITIETDRKTWGMGHGAVLIVDVDNSSTLMVTEEVKAALEAVGV
jgi:hypothetical protein